MDIRDWYSTSPERKHQSKANKEYSSIPTEEPISRTTGQVEPKENLYDFDRDLRTPRQPQGMMSPLSMNPTSPSEYSPNPSSPAEPRRIALTDANVNIPDNKHSTDDPTVRPLNVKRPSSFVGTGTKGKYYGEVLNFSRGPTVKSNASDRSDGYTMADSASIYSRSTAGGGYEALQPPRAVREHPDYYDEVDIGSERHVDDLAANYNTYTHYYDTHDDGQDTATITDTRSRTNGKDIDGKGRVISNSGFDFTGSYAGLGPDFGRGMGRRRDVSGKVVEEGRAVGEHQTAVEGWARFKGL
ncbi:hypothetical protein UCRPC4_g02870 [Phaeomoniella chlamydospora]|uniref:Uncharacterized protein n=1 Tax=Phaeomoniella chlamydospora TaxID=158046 RepID=A0A0G2ELF3_PHACM|nr:hypothetical protein UCRPC4_g02870 [Phaeomoniella chlamydospora]